MTDNIKLDDEEYTNGFKAIDSMHQSLEEQLHTVYNISHKYVEIQNKINSYNFKIEELNNEIFKLNQEKINIEPVYLKMKKLFNTTEQTNNNNVKEIRRHWNDSKFDKCRPLFKLVKDNKINHKDFINKFNSDFGDEFGVLENKNYTLEIKIRNGGIKC